MKKHLLLCLLGGCTLLSAAVAQAQDSVVANCRAAGTTAVISMDATGSGTLQAKTGEEGFSCGLKLEVLEGPPFSESMTGMLVMSFDRGECQPASAHRSVMAEIALHVEDPLGAAASGMTMVYRKPVLFECEVAAFDLAAVRKLTGQDGTVKIKTEKK